jgi:hypothetical protein
MSKTKEAMALVDTGMAPYAAARQVGVASNTLYVALKRRREAVLPKVKCPCCGKSVMERFVRREVLDRFIKELGA